MQYTIRNIPLEIDNAIRRKAITDGKTLNDAVIDVIRAGLENSGQPVKYRDLSDLAGTWVEDPEFDKAIQWQDRIDPEDWK